MSQALYIGLMSGTSLDGLDIALCHFHEQPGVPLQPQLVHAQTTPLPPALRAELSLLSQPGNGNELHLQASADRNFALFCAQQVNTFLAQQQLTPAHVVAIGSHGQTVRHMPNAEPAYTVQLGCPSTLAAHTGIDVVAHFRQKDIALGGQGAPIAPAFHQAISAPKHTHLGILNIGGIANISCIHNGQPVTGFDTGPGNCLLDSWFERHHPNSQLGYDKNGQFAQQGTLQNTLLAAMLADPYFALEGPKSTGREYFNLTWLSQFAVDELSPADVQRTLTEFSAMSITRALEGSATRTCYVCGGGVHNQLLMARITALAAALPTPCKIASTDALGIAPDWVESIAFAWLAWSFMMRHPIKLTSVTGASRHAILGGLFPAG